MNFMPDIQKGKIVGETDNGRDWDKRFDCFVSLRIEYEFESLKRSLPLQIEN